jgi:hypothetical protein
MAAGARIHIDPYAPLPSAIHQAVLRRGCRPPRRSDADSMAVARGHFLAPPRRGARPNDWAVACMRDTAHEVLIFHDGQASPSRVLALWARPANIPNDSGGVELCEGAISRVEPEILAPIVRNGSLADTGTLDATERRAPAHDGILDGDCEGVSVIHYWTGRRWVILPGSD